MLWLLVILPLAAVPGAYFVGRRGGRARLALYGGTVSLGTAFLAMAATAQHWSGAYRWSTHVELVAGLAPASAVFAIAVPLVAAPIFVYSAFHEARHFRSGGEVRPLVRLIALLLAFLAAMELVVIAADLLSLLLGWELVGACSWALIGHEWQRAENSRAASRAFLITRFGDLGLYIAAAAAFAGTASFAYADLGALEGPARHTLAAGVLLAAAAKSAQLPFSSWLFAAMAGPTSASALLHSATMVAAGIYLIIRLYPELAAVAWFGPSAMGIGLVTALAGGIVAWRQWHAKKLLAASTSAQYGLMWLSVGAGFPGPALVHFVAHAFMKAALFLAAGIARHRTGTYALDKMRLGRTLPGIALASAVASLALAGAVPLGAAWSKEEIVAAAGHSGAWLAVLAALAGGISALYATRFQLLAFGRDPDRAGRSNVQSAYPTPAETVSLYALTAATVGLSLLWWPAVGERLAGAVGMRFPAGESWELALSLLLVVAGIGLGSRALRRAPHCRRAHSVAANWFALPRLMRSAGLTAVALASTLARFDDHLLDAAIRAAGRAAPHSGLDRFDERAIDAGIRATARFGQWLARLSDRAGESIFDGAVRFIARGVGIGSDRMRRVHTGQAHQYYAAICLSLAVFFIVLFAGRLY